MDTYNLRQRQPRIKNKAHCEFIRKLPCCICHNPIETQCAHLRFSDAASGKVNAGVGAKPSDWYTVPLCQDCHSSQHNMGDERAFWELAGFDPLALAAKLYAVSGNHELGCEIIGKL